MQLYDFINGLSFFSQNSSGLISLFDGVIGGIAFELAGIATAPSNKKTVSVILASIMALCVVVLITLGIDRGLGFAPRAVWNYFCLCLYAAGAIFIAVNVVRDENEI